MKVREIALGENVDNSRMKKVIKQCMRSERLSVGIKSSLREHPGSIHWHLRKENKRGTLEITWLPKEKRLWLSVHENRRSEWTDLGLSRLKRLLERNLG